MSELARGYDEPVPRHPDPAFALMLNRLLVARELTQADLARDLDVLPSQVSRWVRGVDVPSRSCIESIARFFNVDRDTLERITGRRPKNRADDLPSAGSAPAASQGGMTPEQHKQRARIAGLMLHAKSDSKEIAGRAREGFNQRFEQEADPDGVLDGRERRRRAELLRRAYFARLALKSSQAALVARVVDADRPEIHEVRRAYRASSLTGIRSA